MDPEECVRGKVSGAGPRGARGWGPPWKARDGRGSTGGLLHVHSSQCSRNRAAHLKELKTGESRKDGDSAGGDVLRPGAVRLVPRHQGLETVAQSRLRAPAQEPPRLPDVSPRGQDIGRVTRCSSGRLSGGCWPVSIRQGVHYLCILVVQVCGCVREMMETAERTSTGSGWMEDASARDCR